MREIEKSNLVQVEVAVEDIFSSVVRALHPRANKHNVLQVRPQVLEAEEPKEVVYDSRHLLSIDDAGSYIAPSGIIQISCSRH